jgi:glycosyltransferase involved in cell wall biosynthesis
MAQNGLTLVVPAYNERDGISTALTNLERIRKNAGFDMEVVIVNDGSCDGTEVVLGGFSAEHFKVVNHKEKLGYGAALKTGMRHARFDYIAITDADGTYPDEKIPGFFRETIREELDMLVGARTGKRVSISVFRRFAKWMLTALANYLMGTKIPDINSGFRIMKKDIVREYEGILPDGFSFTTTITLAMLANRCNVKFIPIDYEKRKGRSKIRPFYDTLNFAQLIIRTILCFNPLKIFLPMSAFFIIASVLMVIHRIIAGEGFLVTAIVFFVSGIQLLGLGFIADLIDRRIK